MIPGDQVPLDGTGSIAISARWALLRANCDLDRFLEHCTAAHEAHPDAGGTGAQYAEGLGIAGRIDEKRAVLERLLATHPDHVSLNISYGLELMLAGDYRDAWPYFAYRAKQKNAFRAVGGLTPDRRWRGEAMAGKQMMLLSEQGLGDALQFARYAINVRDAGAKPVLDVHPPLRPLLEGSPALRTVLTPKVSAQIHHWAPMLDLVPFFTPTRADIVWPGAYVAPPALDRPVTSLGHADRLRVGLAWRGNPANLTDFARSMPLAALGPLADVGSCRFYSLMTGDPATELASAKMPWITDLSAETSPFARLATTVAAMDVVVTVCTAIAHLAGAMGKPTFLMLSAMPDWRWGREGTTTPWYPSMRLFRQQRLGDWGPVVEAVSGTLAKL